MADETIANKAHHGPDGDSFVIKSGGELNIESGGKVSADGIQAAAVADANVAHALNAIYSDVEVETALDALGGKINTILTALRGAGVVAP